MGIPLPPARRPSLHAPIGSSGREATPGAFYRVARYAARYAARCAVRLGAAAVAAGLGLALYVTLQRMPPLWPQRALTLRHIELVGDVRLSWGELLADDALTLGRPILQLPLDAIAQRLRAHPWVRTVAIKRRLPDTLRIEIEEHQPALTMALPALALVNQTGSLFMPYRVADGVDVPVLTGIPLARVQREPEQVGAVLRQAVALTQAAGALEATLGALEEVHWDEALGLSLVLQHPLRPKSMVRLNLGHSPHAALGHVVQAATQLVAHIKATGGRSVRIFADGIAHPERLHLQPEA